MAFRVGQKVVCIESGAHLGGCQVDPLVLNRIYTIRDIVISQMGNTHFLLVEVVNAKQYAIQGYDEPVYSARRFRHIVEKKTDISVFTAMLNRSPNLADVGP